MSKRNLRNAESVKSVRLVRRAKLSIKIKLLAQFVKLESITRYNRMTIALLTYTCRNLKYKTLNCSRHMNDESWERWRVEYIGQIQDFVREPRQTQSPALSPITHGSSSSPSSLSPLASSLTRSVFHSELKTWLFSKSFPPWLITRTLGPSNDFTLLNGWICLHGVLD